MKKIFILLVLSSTLSIWTSCTDTNNTDASSSTTVNENVDSSKSSTTDQKKSDGEVILEGGKVILNAVTDGIDKQRIKDSIREANKTKMYAFQIGIKMPEKDAYEAYNKLKDANIPNVYIFKAGKREYYTVQFQAKGEDDLNLSLGTFKSQLGELGTEGLSVINLNDFCSKRETVSRYSTIKDGDEIKCLECE